MPNIEKLKSDEKILDNNVTKITIPPDHNTQDFGKTIFPSKNLAMAQKIIETARPKTRIKSLEISVGNLVKGKKKKGREIIVTNKDQKDILSKNFDIYFTK